MLYSVGVRWRKRTFCVRDPLSMYSFFTRLRGIQTLNYLPAQTLCGPFSFALRSLLVCTH